MRKSKTLQKRGNRQTKTSRCIFAIGKLAFPRLLPPLAIKAAQKIRLMRLRPRPADLTGTSQLWPDQPLTRSPSLEIGDECPLFHFCEM